MQKEDGRAKAAQLRQHIGQPDAGHAQRRRHGAFARGEAWPVVQKETGLVFATVLEHAGVYKRDEEGRTAFLRFVASLG